MDTTVVITSWKEWAYSCSESAIPDGLKGLAGDSLRRTLQRQEEKGARQKPDRGG